MTELMNYQRGLDPDKDAWVTNFFTENHLAYEAFPDMVASPEQLNFMVYLQPDQIYYPCSDALFHAVIEKRADTLLTSAYIHIWSRLERLVAEVVTDPYKRQYLMSLLSIKYNHDITHKVHLPGRLEKRLLGIFTTISEIDRPLARVKESENKRVADFLRSELFKECFDSLEGLEIGENSTLTEIDFQLQILRLRRLLILSSVRTIWKDDHLPDQAYLREIMNQELHSDEWLWLCSWLRDVVAGKRKPTILWLAGRSGEIVFDLAIINLLMKLGIKVILAVKQSFYYHRISFIDLLEDTTLDTLLSGADLVGDAQISKNELLRRLGRDDQLLVISDGTREPFNPLLSSVTFARSFKEADLVVSRSPGCRETITNHFQFTRDMISIIPKDDGVLDFVVKEHHPAVIRFPKSVLRKKAEQLVDTMREEKENGKRIMFYSAIVGSIPGQLQTAKEILDVFVNYLRSSLHDVVVINPAEHFEEGMDADDVMYMWEIFQRSGQIDIWRFQSVSDIEMTFSLMNKKVPPEWIGKDSTYSTGCTKEMDIAREMVNLYPEMQLIGPPLEKFQRRREYGVGQLYDRTLSEVK
ncbi:ARMT1-like domain-containing protein [Desulfogranum japonicum]|uniref:hypothetical protein n=1 Tax=Desulfogranum japonicum TaxID=231447 RepID=UPI0003FFA238|nr:hypothetical protein [Desulfogranum japonicum]